jgi:hypothetical protein
MYALILKTEQGNKKNYIFLFFVFIHLSKILTNKELVMSQNLKRFFSIVLVAIVCGHFTLVFVYASPFKINNKKLFALSYMYVYPVFQQNWELFVPAPNVERKLFVRYRAENGFSIWQDILSQEIMNHRKNRILGNETKVLLLSNSLIYVINSLYEKPSCILSPDSKDVTFKVLNFEVNQYLKNKLKVEAKTSYELLLVSKGCQNTAAYYIKSLKVN